MVDQADRFMVGWTEWAYMGSTGEIKRDFTKPPTPDNLRMGTLRAIVRPYPRLVAGTPRRWRYDRATRRFQALWSTRLPDGRRAGRRVSEVFVPRLHYGRRFRVQVSGGKLLKNANPQLLRIRACSGVRNVMVTVTDKRPAAPPGCHFDRR
jgi:endoglycosylceramidase